MKQEKNGKSFFVSKKLCYNFSGKIMWLLLVLLVISLAVAQEDLDPTELENPTLFDEEFDKLTEEGLYDDIGDVQLEGDAGLTPDSGFYFLETLVEDVLLGNDPERALEYKEEKILELKAMVEDGNSEAAEKALERVEKYNDVIKEEITPELDVKVRASSKAVKAVLENLDITGLDIEEEINENLQEEDKIALAAKISHKIDGLCRALSNLDPLEYAKVCKTDDDAPKWKRELDRELTEEQAEKARKFMSTMSQCFENPRECPCEKFEIQSFSQACSEFAPLVAGCEMDGDEEACEKMEAYPDPIDLLPDYLQDIMDEFEDDYDDAKHDAHIPRECEEAGATSREDCMRVMFKVHAPQECQDALEDGRIDPKNEREAREACEAIMFQADAPRECIEAGLSNFRECERYMFKLDAPQECLDAGLTGESRDDRRKCEAIRFRLDAPQECLDAGIDGTNRDDWKKCELITFKLDAPQECLDAGLTGEGRNDRRECEKIRFMLEAPEECHQFAGERDPWRKCQPIQFKLEAHPACLEAGLDGTGRRDWDECKKIQFKADAPQECLDAGLTGERRDDWRKCQEISEGLHGVDKSECGPEEIHFCDDDGYNCKCVSKEDYDKSGGEGDIDCAVLYCPEGTDCVDGVGCVGRDDAKCDDCASECPGASSTSCDKGYCECFYEDKVSECSDGCHQECGDQNTDCVDDQCVCLGYGEGGPPDGDSDLPPPSNIPVDSDDVDDSKEGSEESSDSSDRTSPDSESSDSSNSDSGGDSGSSDSGSSDSGGDSGSSDNSGSDDSGSSEDSGGDEITGGAVSDLWDRLFG